MPKFFEKFSCLGCQDDKEQHRNIFLLDDDDLSKVEKIADNRGKDKRHGDIPLAPVIHEIDEGKDIRHVEISLVHSGEKIGNEHGGEEKYLYEMSVLKLFEEGQAEIHKEDDRSTGAKNRDHAEAFKIRALKEAPDGGCIVEKETVVLGLVGIDAKAA